MLDVFRFWLDRGVDGFRLDVFNAYFKDPDLRSNPLKPGLRAFNRQHHIHDMDQPEMLPFLNELRKLLDSYPDRYAVGETYIATPEKTVSYCGADRLHAAFSFDFTSYTFGSGGCLADFSLESPLDCEANHGSGKGVCLEMLSDHRNEQPRPSPGSFPLYPRRG